MVFAGTYNDYMFLVLVQIVQLLGYLSLSDMVVKEPSYKDPIISERWMHQTNTQINGLKQPDNNHEIF